MAKTLLQFINSVACHASVAWMALLAMAIALMGILSSLLSTAGIAGPKALIATLAVSIAFPLGLRFLLLPYRWALIYRCLEDELPWFRTLRDPVLIGIGPGGAIIAGMVAKLLGHGHEKEPVICVLDRVYENTEYGEIVVSVRESTRLNKVGLAPQVLVLVPEIHTGTTMNAVCKRLEEEGFQYAIYSITWSPKSTRPPRHQKDRFLFCTDDRGCLPWPDAPAKEKSRW